jgi:cysteine-rich repeat protein
MNMPLSRALVLCVCLAALACTTPESDEGVFTFTTDAEAEESGDELGDSTGSTDDTALTDGNGGPGECGDGVVQDGYEECDLGSDNGPASACTPECKLAACGDGYVYEGFEECDDGNQANGDACVMGCKLATCGDGFVQEGVEECDDGNDDEADGCSSACTPGVCGDGVVQAGEQCDDGNQDTADACPACQLAFCGDGYVQAGTEVCDDGDLDNDDECIAPLCVPAACGDGHLQVGVEACDDGNDADDDACPSSCMPAFCGDGFTQADLEECDDGNMIDDDGCTNGCIALCAGTIFDPGNGIAGCWYTAPNVGMTCTSVCQSHGGFDAAATQHTGNAVGMMFWPQKANRGTWMSIECSSTDNNTNWGANGQAPDANFSHGACHVNCACFN